MGHHAADTRRLGRCAIKRKLALIAMVCLFGIASAKLSVDAFHGSLIFIAGWIAGKAFDHWF